MSERVLFVDDDPNILAGFRRNLRGRFDVTTELSPRVALTRMAAEGAFPVVVSDMRMPGTLNGVTFLSRVREQYPQTVRIMLTGMNDQATAVSAVNEGEVFRFLCKPCEREELVSALKAGIEQYRLQQVERTLLERTLLGSAQLMAETLSIVNPEAFQRTSNIRRYAERVAQRLGIPDRWQVAMAATVSHLGCISTPEEILEKRYRGEALTAAEEALFSQHPVTAARLLANVPRLEGVAAIVERQMGPLFSPLGQPADWLPVHAGGLALRGAVEFDRALQLGASAEEAARHLREDLFLPEPVVAALVDAYESPGDLVQAEVMVDGLREGMQLDGDLRTATGACLMEVSAFCSHVVRVFSIRVVLERSVSMVASAVTG